MPSPAVAAACKKKRAFRSRKKARQQLARVRDHYRGRGEDVKASGLGYYRCWVCKLWHLGRSRLRAKVPAN